MKNKGEGDKSVCIGKKKGTDVRKIMKTTDGYFTKNYKIKKPRTVAVVMQRKDDGALAVVKIHSAEGKGREHFMEGIVLKADKHTALTEDSVVGKHIIVGTKDANKKFSPIYARDLVDTQDKITSKERRKILKGVGGKDKKHHKSEMEKVKRWKKRFKK